MRRSILLSIVILFLLSVPAITQERRRNIAPDEPGEETGFNEELWRFAKKQPYSQILPYLQQAQKRSKVQLSTEAALPTGWKLTPAGTQIEVGNLPYEAVNYRDNLVVLNTGFYGAEGQEVWFINSRTRQVTKKLKLPSLFPSAKVGADNDLYISGGSSRKIYRFNKDFQPVREYQLNDYTAGIVPIDPTHFAVLGLVTENAAKVKSEGKLIILNTATGAVEKSTIVGNFPYDVRWMGGKLFVSLLGSDKMAVYDSSLNPIKTLRVGKKPQTFCSDNDNLYLVNSNSDSLSVIDTKKVEIIDTINLKYKNFRGGSGTSSCTVIGDRLYVTQAFLNAVAVLNLKTHQPLGMIPVGWYPTKVLGTGDKLQVLSAKGIKNRRPNPQASQPTDKVMNTSQYVLALLKGSVSSIELSDIDPNLPRWTEDVESGSPLYSAASGLKLPIKHIFYIVKENRTYDQVLGDLGRGNGDPRLTIFGEKITPNHHQIARGFVTLDNFYVNGEISVLGHSFTTSGYASPFVEWLGNAAYSGRYTGYPFGIVPSTFSPVYLWNTLEAKGIDYRIYGEPYYLYTRAYQIIVDSYGSDSELAKKFYAQSQIFAADADRGNMIIDLLQAYQGQADTEESALKLLSDSKFVLSLSQQLSGDDSLAKAVQNDRKFRDQMATYLYHIAFNYRTWDLKYSDLQRYRDWSINFEKQLKSGAVPAFNYIWLPNDHTAGSKEGMLDPYQYLAQNDTALGLMVEKISRSSVWRDSLILIVEDDSQNGPDHVDATRSVALAMSPYVKRNVVVSDRYDQLSVIRTVELILGLDPLNVNTALAVPMFDIFRSTPDYSLYEPPIPSDHLSPSDRMLYGTVK